MRRAVRTGLIAVTAAAAVGLTVLAVQAAREARRASLEARAERDLASADAEVRVRCARDLVATATGRKILRRHLVSRPEDVVVVVGGVEHVPESTVRFTVTLRNQAADPYWVPVNWADRVRAAVLVHSGIHVCTWDGPALGRSARVTSGDVVALGEALHIEGIRRNGMTDVETFLRRTRLLPAGGAQSVTIECAAPRSRDFPTLLLLKHGGLKGNAWTVTVPPDDQVFFPHGAPASYIGHRPSDGGVPAVPDAWWRATTGDLGLRVTAAEPAPGEPGQLRVTAVLDNSGPHPVLLPPVTGAGPSGLFLLHGDADGSVAPFIRPGLHAADRRHHLFRTRAEYEQADPAPSADRVVTVEDALIVPPGGTHTFTATVPMGTPPSGRRRAILGVVPHEAPADVREPGEDRPWVPFHGHLRSEPFEFTVPARD